MSIPITIEDIYRIFERSQAEDDRRAAEFKAKFEESRAEFDRRVAESRAEADRRAAEFNAKLEESRAEFDRRVAESRAEDDRRAAEFNAKLEESRAEFDRRHAETEKIANKALQSVEGLSSRWGRFVENMVEPSIVRLFQDRNIAVKETHTRLKAKRGTVNMEIDILAVDDTIAVAVEVKSRLTQKQITQFVKRLGQFKAAFPAYRNYQIYGAIAAIEIDRGADTYAYNQGLFMIKQCGDMVKIENDLAFQPMSW
ncbi:MAG: DUF3782 domain-containing protein [Prochlorotrichaceae cyanobacterium]